MKGATTEAAFCIGFVRATPIIKFATAYRYHDKILTLCFAQFEVVPLVIVEAEVASPSPVRNLVVVHSYSI